MKIMVNILLQVKHIYMINQMEKKLVLVFLMTQMLLLNMHTMQMEMGNLLVGII